MDLSEQNLREQLATRSPRRCAVTRHTKHASVAAVLRYSSATPEVLLIRRASKPGDPWSGHMAFPGGRREPRDASGAATAIRETDEEVGIDLRSTAELVGRLDDVQAISHSKPIDLVIVPHVFVLHREIILKLDEREVAEALWAPLGPMFRGEVDTTHPYEWNGRQLELPAYQIGQHIVWGLTHRMLELLFALARS